MSEVIGDRDEVREPLAGQRGDVVAAALALALPRTAVAEDEAF